MLRRLVALACLASLVVAACGSSEPVTDGSVTPGGPTLTVSPAGSIAPSVVPSDPVPTPGGSPSVAPSPTGTPGGSASPEATDQPTPSPASSAADACSGNAANREFFVGVADAVDWTVLCAVLPKGWFVNVGSYRLANGGRLQISYKGPAGATIALSEGAFCQDADGCVPSGSDAGDASLGSMAGTLVELDDGGWAIVVDRAASRSWLFVTHGLDEATTVSLGAALSEVAG